MEKYKDRYSVNFVEKVLKIPEIVVILHEFVHLLTMDMDKDFDKYKKELSKVFSPSGYRDISYEAVADHLALQLINDNYDYIMGSKDSITDDEVTRNRDTVKRMRAKYIK